MISLIKNSKQKKPFCSDKNQRSYNAHFYINRETTYNIYTLYFKYYNEQKLKCERSHKSDRG